MRLFFYSIFDSATAAYMRPFVMQSDGQAVRAFHDEAVRAETDINRHPQDYSLFRLGDFDDSSGSLVSSGPTCLARAHELVARERAGEITFEEEVASE